jgi:S1-C subfamily serine protease
MHRLIVAVVFLLSVGLASAAEYPRALVVKVGVDTPVGFTFAGAVVLRDGVLLSAEHVSKVKGLRTQTGSPVKVVKADAIVDIALLQIDGVKCPCVELAESDAKLDEPVILIGFPYSVVATVTRGESQGVHDVGYGLRLVSTTPVAEGSSGGGMFVLRDGRWQLVGVLAEGNGLHAFAVPVSSIRAFLAKE